MQTLSQIERAESERRDKAFRFEQATNNLANVRRTVADVAPQIERWREQLALLADLAQRAKAIDPGLRATEGALASAAIAADLAAASKQVQARIDKLTKQLTTAQAQLPLMESALAAATS